LWRVQTSIIISSKPMYLEVSVRNTPPLPVKQSSFKRNQTLPLLRKETKPNNFKRLLKGQCSALEHPSPSLPTQLGTTPLALQHSSSTLHPRDRDLLLSTTSFPSKSLPVVHLQTINSLISLPMHLSQVLFQMILLHEPVRSRPRTARDSAREAASSGMLLLVAEELILPLVESNTAIYAAMKVLALLSVALVAC